MKIEDKVDFFEKISSAIKEDQGLEITERLIFDALFIVFGDIKKLDHPVQVLDLDVNFQEAFEALRGFDFEMLESPIEVDLEFERDELFQTKARIKALGFQIYIHKNDKDPWPSDPHAHIYDQNLKIDLRNGDCYRNRVFVRRIRKKELLEIRKRTSARVKFDLPQLQV